MIAVNRSNRGVISQSQGIHCTAALNSVLLDNSSYQCLQQHIRVLPTCGYARKTVILRIRDRVNDQWRCYDVPMHPLIPLLKGTNAKGCLPTEFSGVNLSGMNFSGSVQYLGSRWVPYTNNVMVQPLGAVHEADKENSNQRIITNWVLTTALNRYVFYLNSPKCKSSCGSRSSKGPIGKRRMVSLKTISRYRSLDICSSVMSPSPTTSRTSARTLSCEKSDWTTQLTVAFWFRNRNWSHANLDFWMHP